MKSVVTIIDERISSAMAEVTGREHCAAVVKPATEAKFGDYQANGVMALAKELKSDPRKLAEQVVDKLDVEDICEKPEVAGPGFINLRLKADFVADTLVEINADSRNRLGIDKAAEPKTVVVDFSGPNIAKQMHVGHLRSTIIGDCICRMLEFLGHDVKRQNHIGDWGLQMGMMLYNVEPDLIEGEDLAALESHYRTISDIVVTDEDVAEGVRKSTARLQQGHGAEREYWESVRRATLKTCFEIYDMLGGVFTEEDVRGESFYESMLSGVVEELKRKNLAKESNGAICVFPEGFKNKEGERLPLIVQKSDGAYLYATTDLAAIRYRVEKLRADRMIYVTDARQSLHFEMVFAVARMADWAKERTDLVHVTFGSVLGEKGTPLKTRSGENVKLKDLLDEAVQRAKAVVEEKNPELPAEKKEQIANAVGIGAVKYADYSNNRTSDYIFSFDKMLAMDGNTAPYMQYAYARIRSIERKAETRAIDIEEELSGLKNLNLTDPAELDLAKCLIRYGEA
ncbi:MAG: arginine--tRNA ligase, partial [Planctomycetota bacterium]